MKCACGGSKIRFFRSLETSEGTFIRTHVSQSCLGCILSGAETGNVNNDLKMPKEDCQRAHWRGQK